MAQTFTEDAFAAGHAGLTDLQNMENNFLALKTLFSGSSAPADSTGGMPWFDTGKKLLKVRDSTNGKWIGVLTASTAVRFWLYSNAAEDGWIVDSSVTDRVIAIKGGAQAYNNNGGTAQGTWTISGLSAAVENTHVHVIGTHTHTLTMGTEWGGLQSTETGGRDIIYDTFMTTGGNSTSGAGSTHTHVLSQDAAWRPAAAVGTLQYLDI